MTTTATTHARYFTVATSTPDTLPAFLYDHTRIVSRVDADDRGRSHFLLRTTADTAERVNYLADYQAARLSSGSHWASGIISDSIDASVALHQEAWSVDLTPPVDIDHAELQRLLVGPNDNNPTFGAYRNSNYDGTVVYLNDNTRLELDCQGTLVHVRGDVRDLLQAPVVSTDEAFRLIRSYGKQYNVKLQAQALLRVLEEDVPRSVGHWAVEQAKLPLKKLIAQVHTIDFFHGQD
jgi:hypothetical protein